MQRARIAAVAAGLTIAAPAFAANAPGISTGEILIGQSGAYSGPAAVYAASSRAETAYFNMINDQGGINGRKIRIISLDDGYNPAATAEQTRTLVERDHVAFIFATGGTPTNLAIRKYLNDRKIPHLFVASGGDLWGDYRHYPWSIGLPPSYRVEAALYARYILADRPHAKVALLYQNDAFGRDYLDGLRDGFGANFEKRVVKTESYAVTDDPAVDAQIAALHAAGADTLVSGATARFAAQELRRLHQLNWHPTHFMSYVSSSVGAVLQPAGRETAVGLITATDAKDPGDPRWKDDAGLNRWRAFMSRYLPGAPQNDSNYVSGYHYAETLAHVLRQCGNDLSRANIMHEATNLHDLHEDVLLPGIVVNTSPTNYYPVRQLRLQRFDGRHWVLFSDVRAAS